jgi:hypothetical protein
MLSAAWAQPTMRQTTRGVLFAERGRRKERGKVGYSKSKKFLSVFIRPSAHPYPDGDHLQFLFHTPSLRGFRSGRITWPRFVRRGHAWLVRVALRRLALRAARDFLRARTNRPRRA